MVTDLVPESHSSGFGGHGIPIPDRSIPERAVGERPCKCETPLPKFSPFVGAPLALRGSLGQEYAIGIACHPGVLSAEGNAVKLIDRVLNPREIRRRLGLNQEQFWTQIGVTQSGGSRYESGREMPKPVRELLRLVHVEQIDLSQVKRVDFEIISYLKESHPDLYRSLRRAVRSRHRSPDAPAADLSGEAVDDDIDHEIAQAQSEPR